MAGHGRGSPSSRRGGDRSLLLPAGYYLAAARRAADPRPSGSSNTGSIVVVALLTVALALVLGLAPSAVRRVRGRRAPPAGHVAPPPPTAETPPPLKPLARVLVVATVVVGLGMALAPPASAHTIAGAQPTNYRSTIEAITPAVPGVEVRLLDLGRRVEVVNHTDTDVVVLGYQGEPYLRVGPKGVFENRHSPTLYLNRITKVSPTPPVLPPAADANAPPSWHRIGGGRQVRWSDQRTRWEGPTPASVQNSPDRVQVVSNYTIQLLQAVASSR